MPSPRLTVRNRDSWSDATPGVTMIESFLHVPVIASIGGGLVAMGGGFLAQISSNDAIANTGLWVSLAGIVASVAGLISGMTKAWLDEKQKAREHEFMKLKFEAERSQLAAERELARVKLTLDAENAKRATSKNKALIDAVRRWAHDAKNKFPNLPEPPGFDMDTGDLLIITPDPDRTKQA